MKIVTWNVRGATNDHFRMNVQDLVNTYHPEIFVILEPKIGGSHAERVINHVGLPRHSRVDPNDMSGGIWIMWDDHHCNLDIVCASEQTVTMLIRVNSQSPPWLFFAVYASPTLHKRLILWNNLEKNCL